MEGKGWGKIGPKTKGQRLVGKKIDCGRMLLNAGWRGGWKPQPVLWIEQPTGAIMEVGSLWPSCASVLRSVDKNWLRMKRVDRGTTKTVKVGSEEDKKVERSWNSTNKIWGWELEARIVGERGLTTKSSKLDC